jgi:metal-dependent HD superfamily phosphatase/phosphodiesterase
MPEPEPEADDETAAHEVAGLVHDIGTMLHGRDSAVQSAVLADLLAMWLAGHVNLEDAAATERMRTSLLLAHMTLVCDLIEPNADRIMAQHARGETGPIRGG